MKRGTRRSVLKTMAAVAAAPVAVAQEHQHASTQVVQLKGAYQPKALTPAEMQKLGMLVDLIIPRTDTPGAFDAGVPAFIDRRLNSNPSIAERFRDGMTALNAAARDHFGSEFAVASNEEQVGLLTSISQDDAQSLLGQFFRMVKELTVEGYYTSQAGLVQELGWHGNTYLAEFKGCTHPEHQS